MHGVPADRVHVTGAQSYDHWWGRRPSRAREEFCARVGLRPDRPFLLYVCSSLFRGTVDEPEFVARLDSGGALQQRSPAEGHRHPGAAAPGAARRMARRRSVGLPQPVVLGRAPGGRRVEGRLLRFDVLQRRGRRAQHQRVPRVRLRRQARAHGAAAGDLGPQPGRDDPLPLPAERQRRAAARGAQPRRAPAAARRLARRRRAAAIRRRRRSPTGFIRPFGPDQAGDAAIRRALEQVAAGPAHRARGGAAPLALARFRSRSWPASWRSTCAPSCGASTCRNRVRKDYRATRRRVLIDLKQFAARGAGQAAAEPRGPAELGAHARSSAARATRRRSWPGWDIEEAREIRELVTRPRPQRPAYRRSGPGCRRPASSCSTGFRSWPGPRPTATSIPSSWWSSRAAAPRRGTRTSRPTTWTCCRSTRRTSSASATRSASSRSADG